MTVLSSARARAAVVRLVRSGSRTVMLTPAPGPRLGNFLYFWLHAHVERRAGHPFVVRTPDYMAEWLRLLPGIRDDLSVPFSGVRLRDKRVWPAPLLHQRYGADFTDEDLASFIDQYLVGTPLLPGGAAPTCDVVVNVRRGDYYANERNRAEYGFDIVDYVTRAVALLADAEPVEAVHVVSDDPRWCRDNLAAPLAGMVGAQSYSDPEDSAHDNFRALAGARRLVGSNSTFSYWPAYLLSRLHPGATVVMPSLHARSVEGGAAFQLLPAWRTLEVCPEPMPAPHSPDTQVEPT